MGVESEGGVVRVQVKSTIYKRRGDCYSLNVMGPKRKPYAPGTVDFFAILLIPIDDWYIIPFEVMGRKNLQSALHAEEQAAEVWEISGGVGVVAGSGGDSGWLGEGIGSCGGGGGKQVPRCARNDNISGTGAPPVLQPISYRASGRLVLQLSATMSHAPSRRQALTYLPRSAWMVPSGWWMATL